MSMSISSINRVAIILLNWNGLNDTINCLSSLEKLKFKAFDIILVDNGSSEVNTITSLLDYINNSTVDIKLIQNQKNLGFSGGVNSGIKYVLSKDYSHIALINNDAIVDELWLSELLQSFERDNQIGIVTGSLLHKNRRTIDSTGEMYSIWGLSFPRLRGRPASQLPDPGYVFGATGGASVYRREVFETIGMFDEVFFAYYEDVDLSYRAQLGGWKVYYQNKAVAYHTQGASSSKISGFTTKQAMRNLPLLYIKNTPGVLLFSVGIRFFFAYTLITLKALLSSNFRHALIGWIQGIWLFWAHGVVSRFKIQRQNKASSGQIKDLLWHDLPPDQTGLRKLFGKPVK